MLEEAFSSTAVSSSEAALALLSFIRYELPAGGSVAEARFIRLFPLLCERLFGPMDPKTEFRHEPSGWLSQQNLPVSSTKSPRGIPSGYSSKESPLDNDPVVQLLAGRSSNRSELLPTLIDAISAETEHRPGVRFAFPCEALPKPTQDVMLALLKSSFGGPPPTHLLRQNAVRLTGTLLRVHPRDQNELRQYQQKKAAESQRPQRPLQLSPGLVGSPVTPSSQTNAAKHDAPYNVMLSMLEYYLITFVRYPLATPISSTKTSQPQGLTSTSPKVGGTSRHVGASGVYRKQSSHYGNSVYGCLFRGYLKHLLPHGRARPPFLDFAEVDRDSELFIRVVIEFWFDGPYVIQKSVDAAKAVQERRQRLGMPATAPLTLDASFDMTNVKDYSAPPALVQACLRNLVNHLVSDPTVSLAVFDTFEAVKGRRPSLSATSSPAPRGEKWCITPSMTILQQSFYNYVRMTLRHAPIHVTDSPFFTALNTWLVWLEPWNVVMRKIKNNVSGLSPSKAKNFLNSVSPRSSHQNDIVGVVTVPKATSQSRYVQKWEPYIAANLHLYTVPLAIFLRRARELDFSPRDFHRSMRHVKRVFRVFSKPVVETINRFLSQSTLGHPFTSLVDKHTDILGDFSPCLGDTSLLSCSEDMHTLLEEVYMQHMKAIRELDMLDRFASRLEDLFSHGSSDEAAIRLLIGQARNIVEFPVDFIETQKTRAVRTELGTVGSSAPEKSGNGMLTDRGREDIVSGAVKCNPMDIVYLGDSITARPSSYEIPILVSWTVRLSNWLNAKLLGLTQAIDDRRDSDVQEESNASFVQTRLLREVEESRKNWFRFNLRFLAAPRNVLFIVLISWLLKMFRA